MKIPAGLARAVERAQARRSIAQVLARFDHEEQCSMLLDLLAERTEEEEEEEEEEEDEVIEDSEDATPDVKAPDAKTDLLVAALRKNPRMSIGSLALEVYGLDTKVAQNKTRSLLSALGKRNKVRNVGQGEWEAV